jgi:two-component sensor histidine kinase
MSADNQSNGFLALHRALPAVDSVPAYAAAFAVIAFTAIIRPAIDAWAGEALPAFITFYPAVVIAALCGGPRVATLGAIAAVLLAWYFWIAPFNSFDIPDTRTGLTVGIFTFNSLLLAWIVGIARLMLDSAAAGEAERALAARESVHRTKNVIAIVHALTSKIANEATTVDEFRQILSKRLAALSVAQNALVREDWNDVHLNGMIEDAIAPFLPNPGLTLERGPDVEVPARYVSGLCLALYELCTNAIKYGALANGKGPATLGWRTENNTCVLEWTETRHGGGQVENSGFGTMLIKTALSRDPNTRVDYEFTPTQVIAVFRWPLKAAA